jgi:hypothetical protein
MKRTQNRCARARRGSTTVETLLVLIMITLLFWAFLLVFEMCLTTIVTNHAAFLMGRSHIVGFENDITHRARNVGMIPISGSMMQPSGLRGTSNVEIGASEAYLIEQYIQERYVSGAEMLHYRFWPDNYVGDGSTSNPGILSSSKPGDISDLNEDVEDFTVSLRVKNRQGYKATRNEAGDVVQFSPKNTDPAEYHRFNNIPLFWRYYGWTKGTSDDALEIRMSGRARLMNHAAYYLDSGGGTP